MRESKLRRMHYQERISDLAAQLNRARTACAEANAEFKRAKVAKLELLNHLSEVHRLAAGIAA